MTLQQIIDMEMDDLMRLSRADLAKLTQTVAKNVERRAKNVAKNVPESPALRSLEQSGGAKITTREKDLNALRSEFIRGVNFLQSKTSSVKGAKAFRSRMREIAAGDRPMTPTQEKAFWSAIGKFIEAFGPETVKQFGSDQLFDQIRTEIANEGNTDPDEIISALYEETKEMRAFDYGENRRLSAFFEPES